MELPFSKKNYHQHYRKEWESVPEFKSWLRPVSGTATKAMCAYCKVEMHARLNDIKRHLNSKRHSEKSTPFLSTQRKLVIEKVDKPITVTSGTAETLLSLYIAEHSSVFPINHLGLLCKKAFSDSQGVQDMKLHRTKCGEIIQNILSPHFISALITDIGDSKYSLIIDESTDISVHKYLGMVIKYFRASRNQIVCTFFALAQLESADARGIVTAIVDKVNDMGLHLKNLVGLGTDNASVMVGVNNGVHKILREEYDLPHLTLVKCVCHSLQLAVSHASEETIPRNIEFMLRETYNWFSCSPLRRQEYSNIYETINCGEKPLQILQKCATRWLSIEPVIYRILNPWDELKLFFEISKSKNHCYTSEMLFCMFSDAKNKAYLMYLRSILIDVQYSMKAFEGQNTDPTKLLQTLVNLMESLAGKIIIPTRRHSIDILTEKNFEQYLDPSPHLGYNFEKALENLPAAEKQVLAKRCIEFTVKLIKELQGRLPPNIKILKNINILSVSHALNPNKDLRCLINLVEEFGVNADVIDRIINQWRNIHIMKWIHTKDTVKFWLEVCEYKDAAENNPFQELVEFALLVLVLPHSNADVERVFSQMNIIKTKQRNQMGIHTLNSILYVRSGLRAANKSCYNYAIPKDVIKKVGTKEVYKFKMLKESTPGPSQTATMSNETKFQLR